MVFLFAGRPLLDRLGPAGAAMLAAAAGIVRWAVMAETAWLPALAAIEPLHGLTFALLHLTCMRLLAGCVPRHLAATALTLYGTVGIGAPATLLTLASGPLYARFGAHGFCTTSGSDSIVAVDTNGGADHFVNIATILGVTGLTDEAALLARARLPFPEPSCSNSESC
jgi:hypothetical protein